MRFRALPALLLTVAGASGCATRTQPYRFSSPLLGMVDVPAEPLPGSPAAARPDGPSRSHIARSAPARRGGGWQADAQGGPIRVVSARGIELKAPVASAEEADSIRDERYAQAPVWMRLPAPQRTPSTGALLTAPLLPLPHEPSDLRSLVGTRDKRDSFTIVTSWTEVLGLHVEGTDGPSLVRWAESSGKLSDKADIARPGDLVVFDHVVADQTSDLVALVLARDSRGVTEFLYAGGGVIRRGFLDATRPTIRRDVDGAVVNTFMRHGKQWPPKGTRYLSGELLSHVIHVH
ncbi:MAG TPA: hypothetical protein VLB44_10985 [Kofleriaceae bacterium]|nr:hypothetical protein [Kofleriaceae bacterium]